jgi:hypothetical protein
LVEVELEPEITSFQAAAVTEEPAAAKRVAKLANIEVAHARRLLRDKPGLRSAFILSEILAPPVGVRDNHLF